ncbi:MAG: zf-HC2 domain-containing protein [Candidatus Krumholzibacteriaceae bacterium]|jgi:hypothetical protein
MECHLFRLLIQRYHDGELDPAERAEYENHRRRCEACRVLDGRYALIAAALDGVPLMEPPAGFNRSVLSRVDVAAYRVGPARAAARAIGSGWNAVPAPLRSGIVIAAVCALVIAVCTPLLDYMILVVRQGAEALWSGMIFVRELGPRIEMIWRSIGMLRNYEVALQMLHRTFPRLAAGLNPVEAVLVIASLTLVAVVLHRLLGAARRKGETHVCIM